MPKVTQLVSRRARIQTQATLLCCFINSYVENATYKMTLFTEKISTAKNYKPPKPPVEKN